MLVKTLAKVLVRLQCLVLNRCGVSLTNSASILDRLAHQELRNLTASTFEGYHEVTELFTSFSQK